MIIQCGNVAGSLLEVREDTRYMVVVHAAAANLPCL